MRQSRLRFDSWRRHIPLYLARQFLKNWADMYPFSAEIKSGAILIRPKRIIVAFNFQMIQCFTTGITLGTLRAKFNIYDFFIAQSTFTERLRPQPKDTVRNMLKKHDGMNRIVSATSNVEKLEEIEVIETSVPQ